MSLKSFHIFFVLLATIFSIWFGLWSVDDFRVTGSALSMTFAVISFLGSIALTVYLAWFIKKMRGISFFILFTTLLLSSENAFACATCFGAKDSTMVQSANAGIMFLLAVICAILLGFGSLFIVWLRRAKRLGH